MAIPQDRLLPLLESMLLMRRVDSGFRIYKIHLETEGKVAGIDAAAFRAAAEQAKDICPISVLIKPGLEQLTVNAKLAA